MTTFQDLLFSPWKVFQTLFNDPIASQAPEPVAVAAPVADAIAGAVPIPAPEVVSQAICETQKIGGQLLDICRVSSYAMPDFIFFASLGILAFFLLCLFNLLKQMASASSRLYRISDALKKMPQPKQETSSFAELIKIRKLFLRDSDLKRLWERFEKTLVPEAEGSQSSQSIKDDTLVLTTQSPESIFSKRALIEENVQLSFFNAVPSILTAFGLLMTFVAILDGLSYVSVTDSLDVKGIGGLINGLSGKFFSSVVALACSVSFVLIEKISMSQLQGMFIRFNRDLSHRFSQKSHTQIMHDLHDHLTGRDGIRAEFSAKILELSGKKV